MRLKKNIKLGIINLIILLIFQIHISISKAKELNLNPEDISEEINVLDKVSSKNTIIKLNIGE